MVKTLEHVRVLQLMKMMVFNLKTLIYKKIGKCDLGVANEV